MSESSFDVWPQSPELEDVLKAGAVISGVDSTDNAKATTVNGLADVIRARLETFDQILHADVPKRNSDLSLLELNTAFASLYVLEHVQAIFSQYEASPGTPAQTNVMPAQIGTKDMGQLRTHLSIVFRWGTELLLSRVLPSLPNKRSPRLPPGAQIIDLTTAYEDYTLLSSLLSRLLRILFPDGPQGRASQTFVAIQIYSRCFTLMLRPCICLGWLPDELRGDLPPLPDLKAYATRLFNSVPPSQSITTIGTVQTTSAALPQYVVRVCGQLLCGQLLRPHGVAGLFSALFGEDVSSAEAPLQQLENVAKLLNIVPSTMSEESYFSVILPRLIHLLTPAMANATPPAHKRATAFSISRMLIVSVDIPERDIRRRIISWIFDDAFRVHSEPSGAIRTTHPNPPPGLSKAEERAYTYATQSLKISPVAALYTISSILTNTDPTPALISILLRPIIPQLFSLREHLARSKTADPAVVDLVEGSLHTWARSAEKDEVVTGLWKVIEGDGDDWSVDEKGDYQVVPRSDALPSLTFAQLAELQSGKLDLGDGDEDNALGLRPNPSRFVGFLKSINRDEVASEIYLRVLDAHVKLNDSESPLRKLLFLKLAMQISDQLGETSSGSNPFKKADVTHVLAFVKYALDEATAQKDKDQSNDLTLDKLKFVPEQDKDDEDDGDSDDEDPAPGLEGVDRSEYLVVTAVNLLLALLEGNPSLSPKTVPLLNDVYAQLSPLADSHSDEVRARAREARLMLTARLHTTPNGGAPNGEKRSKDEEEGWSEKYQRALKLLQDPLLPVRAHGLLLLRELVSPKRENVGKKRKKKGKEPGPGMGSPMAQGQKIHPPAAPSALIPAILSIFLQAAQDEDSYIFLNAVQGLAAMVDGFGKDVLKGLVEEYARGLEGLGSSEKTLTLQEVDKRVRVGEALGQVIKRCGGALGGYVDIIVPRVFAVVRASHLPTSLRTSAISLLATAADTSALALNAYVPDLMAAMIDLVQVESVRTVQMQPKGRTASKSLGEEREEQTPTAAERTDVTGSAKTARQPVASGRNKGAKPARQKNNMDDDNKSDSSAAAPVPETMDSQPTAANPKFPPLRRAALHFLALLVRSLITRVYESEESDAGNALGVDLPDTVTKRGTTVLKYVAATDADEVVRTMAREAAELLDQLRRALLGLQE